MTGWEADDDPSRETIALLQEEIARLEAELRARDEALPAPHPAPEPAEDDAARRRVEELVAELAARDELVALLLEQSELFEAAAAAQRAEWEQLSQWVEEVERRVDGREAGDAGLRSELDAERQRSDSLRRRAESDRREWEAHRAGLERDADHLRGLLAQQVRSPEADETAFIALASENRKLRTTCAGLERAAAEAEALGGRLAEALAELESSRNELRRVADDRERERNEHEAELAALRAGHARESLQRQGEPAGAAPAPAAPRGPALDADERIRAFRQHLKELHEHEASQRAGRSLSSRLSRLWRNTGPA
jgi:hypothetical protein